MTRHARGWRWSRERKARECAADLAHSLTVGNTYGAGLYRIHRPKEVM